MKLYRLTILRLKSYFKNPTLILSFGIFVLLLWGILNFTLPSHEEVLVLPIGVVDLDESEYSKLITQRVSQKETIAIVNLSQEEILKQVSTGKLEAAYILKEGLMDQILDGNSDELIEMIKSPVSLSSGIIGELFSAEVLRLSSNVDAAHTVVRDFASNTQDKEAVWNAAWDLTDAHWEPSPVITTAYELAEVKPLKTGTQVAKTEDHISRLLIMALLMFSILMTTSTLLKEKNNGIIKRIKSSQTPLWIYVLSSVLSIIIVHTVALLIIMVATGTLSVGVVSFVQQLLFYVVYMILVGSLGLTLVALTTKMQQLLLVIPFLTLVAIVIGFIIIQ